MRSGDTYYRNTNTGESTWDLPTAPAPKSVAELPNGWETAVSRSSGETYYVNQGAQGRTHLCMPMPCGANQVRGGTVTGESSFDLPTEAALPDGWTVSHDPATDTVEFINKVR